MHLFSTKTCTCRPPEHQDYPKHHRRQVFHLQKHFPHEAQSLPLTSSSLNIKDFFFYQSIHLCSLYSVFNVYDLCILVHSILEGRGIFFPTPPMVFLSSQNKGQLQVALTWPKSISIPSAIHILNCLDMRIHQTSSKIAYTY